MYSRSGGESIEYARQHNYIPDIADENELQLDIDNEEQYEHFQRMRPAVEEMFDVTDIVETPSKSGNRHIRLFTAYNLSVPERIALQALLGSDPKKELISLRRWLNGDPVPILLFELPKEDF